MTNREKKIAELRNTWFALQSEKDQIVKKAWDIEYKQELIREKLIKYTNESISKEQGILDHDRGNCGSTGSVFL